MGLDNIIKNDPEWNHNIEYIKIKNKNCKSMNEINNAIKNLDNNNTNVKIYDKSLLKEIKEKEIKDKEKEKEKKKKYKNKFDNNKYKLLLTLFFFKNYKIKELKKLKECKKLKIC